MTSLFGRAAETGAGGLRERKKARTKIAIQSHAVRLFREQGYAATTVEQVAEAAEVSPSTVFRYFPTKEDLVVHDDYDPVIYAAFESQPPELNLIQAWRAAIREAFAQMTPRDVEIQLDRGRLLLSVPELWGATLHGTRETLEIITDLSAARVGTSPEDPALQATVGAIFGVLLTAALNWVRTEDPKILSTLDAALVRLDEGLLR
ncbi:TetR/AcrR family transcriptional regulator [Actinophytocola oryzae]|uniref:TetR family transcriptional regulator n=1 Tax=Actinophytocola oryzae TaxID=502181 RepID=A0A4R7V524_9PSEU|nr:TetR family transcriptional regulator [Actinophytocola oryzae]TDV42606.1 TetR family transcriptional regulator [Actinophytocola oryzae]